MDDASGAMQGRPAASRSEPQAELDLWLRVLKWAVPSALVVAAVVLLIGLSSPLLGFHSFRQSQTAIATYWMLHGSSWLSYETPVLGPPWSIPFEFPLYNWLVAGLVQLTGWPLDTAGRLVSFVWFLLCLLPARSLFQGFGLPRLSFLLFAVLFLASPLYLFWGRAFLMETQALCFSLSFLAALRHQLAGGRGHWTLLATLASLAACLTKITTMLPFLALALVMVAASLVERRRAGALKLSFVAVLAVSLILPLACFSVWNAHADALKAQNAIATLFRSSSSAMLLWNFGSLQQRVSADMARALGRGGLDIFGWLAPVAGALVVAVVARRDALPRRERALIGSLVAAFMLPWLVFTNLYIAHNYYEAANAVFAIAAVAIALGGIVRRGLALPAAVLTGALLVSQYSWFAYRFWPMLTPDPAADQELAVARYLRENTPRDSVIAIYGLDWSSLVPYYSERKAIMEPTRMVQAPREVYLGRLHQLLQPLDGMPMSAVVRCDSRLDDEEAVRLFDALARQTRTVSIANCRIYVAL